MEDTLIIHKQLCYYNEKSFITNFQNTQEELYRRAIDEYNDPNLIIKDEAYDSNGRRVVSCKSLHYIGSGHKCLSGFWDIFDGIRDEVEDKEETNNAIFKTK